MDVSKVDISSLRHTKLQIFDTYGRLIDPVTRVIYKIRDNVLSLETNKETIQKILESEVNTEEINLDVICKYLNKRS